MAFLICDLDGTLLDSAKVVTAAMDQTLRECLGIELSQSQLLTFLGPPLTHTIGRYAESAGMTMDEIIFEYRQRCFRHESKMQFFPQAIEFLREASNAGHRLAVGTSRRQEVANRIIANLGMDHYFDVIFGALDDHEDGKEKIIQRVLQTWDNPSAESVLMVGDRIHDIEGARKNGLRTVIVTWGSSVQPDEVIHAWAQVDSAIELLALVNSICT